MDKYFWIMFALTSAASLLAVKMAQLAPPESTYVWVIVISCSWIAHALGRHRGATAMKQSVFKAVDQLAQNRKQPR